MERGEGHLVGAHGAGQRMLRDGGQEIGTADDDTGLGSAEQLVARERDDVRTGIDRLANSRLVLEPRGSRWEPRRGFVEQARPGIDHHGGSEVGQRADLGGLGEPDHPVVGCVDLEEERGGVSDGAFVVRPARTIRGADLDERAAGLGHDLGHTKSAADLDELAARDHHFSAARQCPQREEHRGSVVVDDEPGFRANGARQERSGVVVTGTAGTGVEAELEGGGAPSDCGCGRQRFIAEGRTTEVGVQQHAGGVDHRLQETRPHRCDACLGISEHVGFGGARATVGRSAVDRGTVDRGTVDRGAGGGDRIPGGVGQEIVGETVELTNDALDRRQRTPGIHRRQRRAASETIREAEVSWCEVSELADPVRRKGRRVTSITRRIPCSTCS